MTGNLRSLTDLPGPRGLPLLGNILQLNLNRLHQVVEAWCREYGTPFQFRIGRRRMLVVADPALIKQVLLERPGRYRRYPPIQPVFAEMGGSGLFSAEGDEWRRQRRIWMAALNAHRVEPFLEQMTNVTERLLRHWQAAADVGRPVDVLEELMRYTVDVTMLFAFGHEVNSIDQVQDPIQDRLSHLLPAINRRINAPFAYWRYLPLPADLRLRRALKAVHRDVETLIAQARARLAADPERAATPANLLEALLCARDEESDGEAAAFSDEEIYGSTLTALVAGEDTTANTLAWIVHFLAQDQELQTRLSEQLSATLGPATFWRELEDLNKLACVDALTAETMRLKPIAPVMVQAALADCELGGLRVPAGTNVMMALRVAALAPERYPDPHSFRPQRWQDGAEKLAGFVAQPPTPFGAGPRMCPGRNLAQSEIRSVVTMLLAHFTIEPLCAADQVEEHLSFTMAPRGLRVRLHWRR
ncbi:MAG: cytochrome P450 [Salinisphaera sp.]|nr:cytochrome P450 [Salinisphaera sp.]